MARVAQFILYLIDFQDIKIYERNTDVKLSRKAFPVDLRGVSTWTSWPSDAIFLRPVQ